MAAEHPCHVHLFGEAQKSVAMDFATMAIQEISPRLCVEMVCVTCAHQLLDGVQPQSLISLGLVKLIKPAITHILHASASTPMI